MGNVIQLKDKEFYFFKKLEKNDYFCSRLSHFVKLVNKNVTIHKKLVG